MTRATRADPAPGRGDRGRAGSARPRGDVRAAEDPDADALVRIGALRRAVAEEVVDRVETFRWGTALLAPSLPQVWDANLLRVERLPRTAPGRRIAAVAERLLGTSGAAHRKVICELPALGVRLAPALAALGWQEEVLLVMRWAGGSPAAPSAGEPPVEEASFAALRESYRTTLGSFHGAEPEVCAQLLAETERARSARRLAIRVDGRPVSLCRLYVRDGAAEIDDVSTLPEFRGRGLAGVLTRGAVRHAQAAGCDLVFLRADEADRPRDLYARLGFRAIGRHYAWVRRPPAKSLASRA